MALEKTILTLPWVSLPLVTVFLPGWIRAIGLPLVTMLATLAIGALSSAAGLASFDLIFPPPGGIDCGFCQAIGEMVAASLLFTAIGIGSILVWNVRKFGNAL